MTPRKTQLAALVSLVTMALLGAGPCKKDDDALTAGEATEALEELTVAEQALTLTSGSIEIATDFTIGDAAERAAEEVRAFIHQQLPCAEVTLAGATLSVEYGALPGDCTYRGQRYGGRHTITVTSTTPGDLVVDHEWDAFTNGVVSVSGTAHVTWSSAETLRRTVVHDLTWTRLSDGRQGVGTGDRTQTPLPGGLVEGIRIDGERTWTTSARAWRLDIDAVEARWIDPIPQSGTYWLTTPADKLVTLTFARVDEDTIAATLAGGGRSFTFNVSKLGVSTAQ